MVRRIPNYIKWWWILRIVLLVGTTVMMSFSRVLSSSECQWILSPSGQMTCFANFQERIWDPDPTTKEHSRAACVLQNASRAYTAELKKLRISCDFNSPKGIPLMDAKTFSDMETVEEIFIKQSSFKSLPPKTFCHLPNLRSLAFVQTKLTDLNRIGLSVRCGDLECAAADTLADLWVSTNNLTQVTKEGPLCNLSKLKTLGLDENDIRDIEPGAFENLGELEEFFLPNNSLTLLDQDTFRGLRKLTLLDISNNRIRSIRNAFVDLGDLRELSLENNELEVLTKDTFIGLSNLRTIYLSHNKIQQVQEAFRPLKSLTTLQLNDNRISSLASTWEQSRNSNSQSIFDGMDKLTRLWLQNNLIVNTAGAFTTLPSLEWLRIDNNRMVELTADAFNMSRTKLGLKHVFLKNNMITKVHADAFHSLSALDTLVISENQLASVPNLKDGNVLRELDLSDNGINEINDDAFTYSTKLRTLNLCGNRIHTLGDHQFQNLLSLETLQLSRNMLQQVGNDTFTRLTKLTTLGLAHNSLDFTRNFYEMNTTYRNFKMLNTFRYIGNLTSLNLSYNGIREFEYYWFPRSLKQLDLSHNEIDEVRGPLIRFQNPNIRHLDLSYNNMDFVDTGSFPFSCLSVALNNNRISYLHNETFFYMLHLQRVHLEHNQLQTLNDLSTYFNTMYRIPVKFWLAPNPLVCNCGLEWIRNSFKGTNFEVQDFGELRCQSSFEKHSRSLSLRIRDMSGEENFLCKFQTASLHSKMFPQVGQRGSSPQQSLYTCPLKCNCFHDVKWTLIVIDCSSSNLLVVPHNLPMNTNTLYLDGNRLESLLNNELQWLESLQQLHLNHNFINKLEDDCFESLVALEKLHLDHNSIGSLPVPSLFRNQQRLTKLDLSYNQLANLSEALFSPLISLESLYLDNNQLVDFPVWQLAELPSMSEIGLYNNPWSCDCDYAKLYREWMRNFTGKLIDKQNMQCVAGNHNLMSLITFNVTECYENLSEFHVIWLVISLSTLAVTAVIAILVFLYRREMQVLLYSHYGMRLFHGHEEEYDEGKTYDAFVSYSTHDEGFVVEELLPGLEGGDRPYRLCLHHRDFPIGAFINESIFEAIAKSRRSIIVLSHNFVQSEWCRFEFRTAHSQMLHDRCKRVVVILLGDMPAAAALGNDMKLYLRTNTYLSWGDRLFWEKLYYVLPKRPPLV